MSRPSIEQLAALAWNGSKADDDPPFHLCAQDHREKLAYHAQNVVKGGAVTTPFDRAVRDALAGLVRLAPEVAPQAATVAVEPTIAPPEPAKPIKTKKGK